MASWLIPLHDSYLVQLLNFRWTPGQNLFGMLSLHVSSPGKTNEHLKTVADLGDVGDANTDVNFQNMENIAGL